MNAVSGPSPHGMGFTYIARRTSTDRYKIGSTWDWYGRSFAFRCSGLKDVVLVALIPGAFGVELRLHALFEPYHLGHEWFSPEIAPAVEQIAAGTFDWSTAPDPGWCITKPFQTKASLAHWGPLPRPSLAEGVRAEPKAAA